MVEYPPAVIYPISIPIRTVFTSEYGDPESIIKNVYLPMLLAHSMGIPVISDETRYEIIHAINEYIDTIMWKE